MSRSHLVEIFRKLKFQLGSLKVGYLSNGLLLIITLSSVDYESYKVYTSFDE